jgi:hypothetical protein
MNNNLQSMADNLMCYCQKELGFKDPPSLFFQDDEENAKNTLGKTAYYDPGHKKVVIYVTNRHSKDVLRSLAHELVHHMQNLRGDFDRPAPTGPGYAQKDPHLRNMEKEAYLLGNILFRDWEDNLKAKSLQENKEVHKMNIDTIKEIIKKQLIETLKKEHARSDSDEGKKKPAPKPAKGPDPSKIGPGGINLNPSEPADWSTRKENTEELEEGDDAFAPNHYCVHHGGVQHEGRIVAAVAIGHNYNEELERVTHYNMKLEDGTILENVAFEDIQVTNASLAEGHGHPMKRDDEELEEQSQSDLEEETDSSDTIEEGSKIQTPEQENLLYEARFTPRDTSLFNRLVSKWTKK